MEGSNYVIVHPNREKASSKATKSIVALLLLVSAALVLIVTLAGWEVLAGAQVVAVFYVIVYCVMAFYVMRWSRGVLAVSVGLAIALLTVAVIATPGWFSRDGAGYEDPFLPSGFLGLLTLVLIPAQVLLILFSLRGFGQNWNTEVEVTEEEAERGVEIDEEGRRVDDRADEAERGERTERGERAERGERTEAIERDEPEPSGYADDRARPAQHEERSAQDESELDRRDRPPDEGHDDDLRRESQSPGGGGRG